MIELKDISKVFGNKTAVDNISFRVNEGETMVLLGTSGCGKTTTLKLINRLIDPSEGTVFLKSKNITTQRPEFLRREMGYVLQNIGLFPHYTIAENIAVVPKLLGWTNEKIKIRTEVLLEKLHLPISYLALLPKQLSGGQQQRVGLARALAADPPILLMDEPFGALDNVTRGKIHADFLGLDELKTKTILMVTHDVQEAFTLSDRICLMHEGKVIQIGTPKELLFKPVNSFAKSFLDAQRLALQFKVITLKDLIPYLNQDAQVAAEQVPSTMSVWEAMEKLKQLDGNHLCIANNSSLIFDFGKLMMAFDRYQNLEVND